MGIEWYQCLGIDSYRCEMCMWPIRLFFETRHRTCEYYVGANSMQIQSYKVHALTLRPLCVSTSLNEIDLAWLSRMEFYDFRFVMFLLATVSIVIEFNEQAQLLSSACEWPSCGQGLAIVCLFSGLSRCHSKPFHSQYSFLFIWSETCSLLHDLSHTRKYNQIHVQSFHPHGQSAWVRLFVCSSSKGSGNVEHLCLDTQFFNGTVCWQTTKQLAVTLRCRTPSMAEQSV